VGIVATDAASQNPEAVDLVSICQGNPPLARTIKTDCPCPEPALQTKIEAAEPVDKSKPQNFLVE